MQPRDWVIPMVTAWATQKRKLVYARSDGHLEGWSELSILGRVLAEGAGASHSSKRMHQHHPEVYTGDALLVQRALDKMPEFSRTIMCAHYVIKGMDVTAKATALGVTRGTYYQALDNSYHYIAGRLDEMNESKVA